MRKSSPKYTRRHYIDIADTLTNLVNKNDRLVMVALAAGD